jgi:hypothetical protein
MELAEVIDIEAIAVIRPLRLRYQSDAFVVANGFGTDTRFFAEIAYRKHWCTSYVDHSKPCSDYKVKSSIVRFL